MKLIKIKCVVSNSLNLYKFHVLIYNQNDCVVFDSYTDNCGNICLNCPCDGIYKVTIYADKLLCPFIMYKNIILSKYYHFGTIYFIFNKKEKKVCHKVTFNLLDQFYNGLKIEKGDLKIWQNHM